MLISNLVRFLGTGFLGRDALKAREPQKANRRMYVCDDEALALALESQGRDACETRSLGRAEQAAAACVQWRLQGVLPTLVLRTNNWLGWAIKTRALAPWAVDILAPGPIEIRRARNTWKKATGLFDGWHILRADAWKPFAPRATTSPLTEVRKPNATSSDPETQEMWVREQERRARLSKVPTMPESLGPVLSRRIAETGRVPKDLDDLEDDELVLELDDPELE